MIYPTDSAGNPVGVTASDVYQDHYLYDIFLLDSSGNAVNVTASYVYQDHYLYDVANNLIGIVGSNDIIYDLNGYQIGYIAVNPGE